MLQITSKPLKNTTFVDLCCGIGGFHLAAEALGSKCVLACDIDKYAKQVYQKNFGIEPTNNIRSIAPADIPDHDILMCGFPCQPFSVAGKKAGFNDSQNGDLIFRIIDIIKVKQPKAILLENVSNLATIDNGKTFDRIKKELIKCGYKVYASELNASDYGVPQQRKRLYIVAFRKDLVVKNFRFPKPVTLQKYVKDILEPKENIDEKKYVFDLSFVCKGNPDYYSHSPVKLGIIGKGGQGERVYSINGTAITVTAKSGGKFRNTGGYYINGKLRRLTVRECARLMGFPDSFRLNCSETQAYKLLGNSVVVDVIEYILISMAEAMKKVDAI